MHNIYKERRYWMSINIEVRNYFINKSYKDIVYTFQIVKDFGNENQAAIFKSLERLTAERFLTRISKGVYCRYKEDKYGPLVPSERNLKDSLINKKSKGMEIGYGLYNKYKLTTQIGKEKKVYSNFVNVKSRRKIKNIIIKNIDYPLNRKEYVYAIEFMEIVNNVSRIEDINYSELGKYLNDFFKYYYEYEVLKNIFDKPYYSKSTIATVENLIEKYNKYTDACNFKSYLNVASKYKIEKWVDTL